MNTDIPKVAVTIYMVKRGNVLITSSTFPTKTAAHKAAVAWNKECRAEGTPANFKATARTAYAPIPQY